MRRWDYPERERGAADNDQPYRFGQQPRAVAPWPFTERQYARLLILRGRIRERIPTQE